MITASAMERVAACPASAVLPQADSTTVFATRGTVIHQFLATAKGHGRDQALANVPDDCRAVCEAIDLDTLPVVLMPEASYIYDTATGKARFLGANIGRRYGKLSPTEVAGTADVVGVDGTRGYVADWFTGFGEMRKGAQLRFLALCLARVFDLDEVTIEAIQIRADGSTWRDTAVLDALELDIIAREVADTVAAVAAVRKVLELGGTPNVSEGDHCRYCKAWTFCPAKTRLLAVAASGADVTAPFLQGGLTRDMVGPAWLLAEQLDSLAKELKRRVHGAVEEFGEVPTPRGTVLKKVITPGNEKLDGDVVWSVVRALAGDDVANAAVERHATKKQLGEALRKRFGRDGAAKEREVLDAVRGAGGASRKPSEKLDEVCP